MKNYYVCKRETYEKYFGNYVAAHYLDLENGEIVLCAEFRLPSYQDAFEKEIDVISFPHLLDHPAQPVGFSIASKCEMLGLDKNHTTFRAAMRLKQHHPEFDPRHSF